MYGFPEPLFTANNPQPVTSIVTNLGTVPMRESMFSMNRGKDIWYSIKDGNWNDPTVWRTTSGKRVDFPGSATTTLDDVYIKHTVTMNVTAQTVNNLFVAPNGIFNFTISGNIQCLGIVNINSTASNLLLNGTNNYINSFLNPTNSTITYNRNGDQNIMNLPYYNLTISINAIPRAIKYFISDLTVSNTLTVNGGVSAAPFTLELGGYNLTVSGVTNIGGSGFTIFSKIGGGSLLFVGLLTIASASGTIVSLTGNPTIELRGGIASNGNPNLWGTNPLTFTTNNQAFSGVGALSPFNDVLISGAITITNNAVSGIVFNGTLTGDNTNSIFDNRQLVHYKSATAPMVTGKLYCNQATNTWFYNLNGAQDIQPPTDPVSPGYSNLTLSIGGAKKLLGNVSVKGTYTLSAPATLNSNGFALTNP